MKKIIFFFLLINCGVFAQTLDSTIFKIAPSFSGQVAVMRGDSLIFAGSCGWMNYPMQQKMNNNVMIEIGELSSQFTREAFQELIDKNTISVNEQFETRLKSFYQGNKERGLSEETLKRYSDIEQVVKKVIVSTDGNKRNNTINIESVNISAISKIASLNLY